MTKRILAIILSLMLMFTVIGCGNTATPSDINVNVNVETDSEESSVIENTSDNSSTDAETSSKEETSSADKTSSVDKTSSIDKTSSADKTPSKDEASKDNSSANTNSNGINMDSLKGKTVKMLMWRDLTNQEKATIKKFETETSMKVSVETTTWANYMTKLASMVSTGDSPDVAIIPTQQNSQGCFPLGTATLFQPISVTKQDLKDSFWDLDSMEKFKIKGHYFTFIAYNNWYDCNGVVMYNVDIFKDAGITTPRELWKAGNWNWDTLKSTATELTKKGHIGYYNGQTNNLMQSMGVDFVNYDGKTFTSDVTSKEVTNAWVYNAQMIEAGVQPAHGTESTCFEQGRAGMIGTNLWAMRKDANYGNLTFEIDAVPFPSPKGASVVIPANVNLFGIAKGAKNPIGAGVFIREFLDSKNNGNFADVAINPNMEDVFNYATGKDVKKGYKFTIGVVGYTNLTNLKTLESTLAKTASTQITTVLQKNKSLVDNAVKTVNNKLK